MKILARLLAALFILMAKAQPAPPSSLPCFPGAYYRKAVSSFDHWTGIEGVITLPEPLFDPQRRNANGALDNLSIYLGGQANGEEIDAGLTWAHLRDGDGGMSRERKAFRIFWRNDKWHMGPDVRELTFFPGDTVRLSCTTTERGKLNLSVQLISRGGSAPRDFQNKTNGLFEKSFSAPFFGPEQVQQFKRVNAIDQVGREGKSVEPTATKVMGATWREVWLWRGTNRIAMTPDKFTDMRCPNAQHVEVITFNASGERVSILGSQK